MRWNRAIAVLSLAVCCVILLAWGKNWRVAAQSNDVDLALVLAIDCSFSVDANEFRQQMQGLGDAFRSQEVKDAIGRGPLGRIAILAMQWSDENNQLIIVPWTIVGSDSEADALGARIAAIPRRLAEGGTSISSALLYAELQLDGSPAADRKVVDLSSDGRNNTGVPVSQVRDRLVARGITINAVTILNEWPTLDTYFENNVVGGQAHFVIPSADYQTYTEAIHRKLVREITGPGIS